MTSHLKYILKIEGTSPADAPMCEVGRCVSEFANILGPDSEARLVAYRDNCIALDATIPLAMRGAVERRIANYPIDNRSKFDGFNKILAKINAEAVLYDENHNAVLRLLGKNIPREEEIVVLQDVELKAKLVQVGSAQRTTNAWFDIDDSYRQKIQITEEEALSLCTSLYNYFLIKGSAKWVRDGDGKWSIADFHRHSITQLDSASLEENLLALQENMSSWEENDDIEEIICRIRKDA